MLDIITYLREYSDRYHHLREEEAFERLAPRCPDLELPLARLAQEHRVLAHAGETLRERLQAAVDGALLPRAEIEVAAATYLVYYGSHIAREEKEVLPRAAQTLTPADWMAVKGAAPGSLVASDAHLRELRRIIALEA
jgi:hemerythrin-like domain-containing protein